MLLDQCTGQRSADNRQRILALASSGQTGPSRRLPAERRLAEQFGVGRAAIREALAGLETLGVLETRVGAGSYFKEGAQELLPQTIEWGLLLGRPETADLVEARTVMELASAGLAAERATDEEIDRLRAILMEMEEHAGDPEAFIDADVRFHIEIARMARNSVIERMLTSIRSLLEVWIRRASGGEEAVRATLVEHRRIVDAISSRTSDFATGAMRLHMTSAGNRLRATLEESRERLP
ncbi:FadR/GntR family transcriptional regulator [Arthrobacter sp. MMS24-S77]